MPEQIYVGNFSRGLQQDRLAFNLDNDAFPELFNFYSWRGRIKRKRGTTLVGRLQVQVQTAVTPNVYQQAKIGQLNGSGTFSSPVNLISQYSLPAGSSIVPGSISFTDGTNNYTDAAGVITGSPAGEGTINYATGILQITGGAANANVTGIFSYFPGYVVMGLRELTIINSLYFDLLAFDTNFSYQINPTTYQFYNITFYKTTNVPFQWSGQDYQQFWTTNYFSAFWATNNKPGFNFVNGTYTSGSGTSAITFNFKSNGSNFTTLIDGDVLWFNEWNSGGSTINGLTGTITTASGASSGNYVVTFSSNQTVAGTGIAQILTNTVTGQDGVKWYDGDPTNKTGIPTTTSVGWINFAPALTAGTVSIDNNTASLYYLVGALAIVPFKDRILFFSPWIQKSNVGASPIQLTDTVIWSWTGTPYYGIAPSGLTTDNTAFYVDEPGKGGDLSAGINQEIVTVQNNEDVLLVGFTGRQTRFVATGNDVDPFSFFFTNLEFGSLSTFGGINLDRGAVLVGQQGIIESQQIGSNRIDVPIPDTIFQISRANFGAQRVSAARDYYNEWILFSYPSSSSQWFYPTETLFWNYRNNTWAQFYETYTARGQYRIGGTTGTDDSFTWATLPYESWASWNEPWNSAAESIDFPSIISGNTQGFVLNQSKGTDEDPSGYIINIQAELVITAMTTGATTAVTANNSLINGQWVLFLTTPGISISSVAQVSSVTSTTFIANVASSGTLSSNGSAFASVYSINHCLNSGDDDNNEPSDFIYISTALGLTNFVGNIYEVNTTPDANNFFIDTSEISGTYLGNGQFAKLSQPFMQSKQFNPYWEKGRKVRIGVQKYLMDATEAGQVSIQMYLGQDSDTDFTNSPVTPSANVTNSAQIYSEVMFTSPEPEISSVFNQTLGTIGNGVTTTFTFNYSTLFGYQNGNLNPGSVFISVGTPAIATFTDNGNGNFNVTGTGKSGTINYGANMVTIVFSAAPTSQTTSTNFQYTNTNIQMPVASLAKPRQIWHRMNNSLIGDSFQIGITLNDQQMMNYQTATSEIVLHAMQFLVGEGPLLA